MAADPNLESTGLNTERTVRSWVVSETVKFLKLKENPTTVYVLPMVCGWFSFHLHHSENLYIFYLERFEMLHS